MEGLIIPIRTTELEFNGQLLPRCILAIKPQRILHQVTSWTLL
jgi:hypothetical protein